MKYFIVDAFTDLAFRGNPAAVCILNKPVSEEYMQNVASEINLSETAYLLNQKGIYSLRWFTPTTEIDLCGHATLASAHILWEKGFLDQSEQAKFDTNSGILTARKKDDFIEMDFPVEEAEEFPCPPELADALSVEPVYVGKNRFDFLVEVGSEEIIDKIAPDFEIIKKIDCRGVIVTSRSERSEYDFVSRFFAPLYGVPEDPVTGSAHCALGPYWSKKTGKTELKGYQTSKRGGTVNVTVSKENVVLGGKALTVAAGELIV